MDQKNGNPTRPIVLDKVSETQIEELERQFAEGDHNFWNELTKNYGWTPQQSQDVWNWFGQKSQTAPTAESFQSPATNSELF